MEPVTFSLAADGRGREEDHARSPDTGRLSGCVQELNCLSTTHKEK
jgi:hypothetical protein